MPACGQHSAEWSEPPARLTAGIEGNRLQAIRRPARCRRVPSTPPKYKCPRKRAFLFVRYKCPLAGNTLRSGVSRLRGSRRESKGIACKRFGGLQDVGESRPLRQNTNAC